MQFSKSLEQACCVLGIVAKQSDYAVTSAELNKYMSVSPTYLSKITRKLVVAKLIRSVQGVNGGYILARPMTEITLRMVVEAIEGNAPFFTPTGVIERVFLMQRRAAHRGMSLIEAALHDAEVQWRHELEKTTMQQVMSGALSEAGR